MIDLNQLRYFVTVAETGNVGRAAKLLNITQSPLSRQIQDLEYRLGILLFERVKRRLHLTRAGQELLADAKKLLEQAERLERKTSSWAKGKRGVLEIGYVDGVLNSGILPDILRNFRKRSPDIDIRLHAMRSTEQFQAVEDSTIDVGFTYSSPPESEVLLHNRIHEENFVLAVPADEVEKDQDGSGNGRQVFICFPDRKSLMSTQGRINYMRALESLVPEPDIKYEVSETSAVLGLVSAGLGHAVIQESLKKHAPDNILFKELPSGFPIKMEIHLIVRRAMSPIVSEFRNLVL